MNEKRERVLKIAVASFVLCLITLRLFWIYYPFHFFGYLVPPGDDPAVHYQMVKSILEGKISFDYPPLFHIIIAGLVKLFQSDPMTIMRIVTPAMIVLPSLAVLAVATKLFGRGAGLISFVVVLWTSNYGLMAFGDGNYPNILAAGFFLPLAILYFIKALQSGGKRNYFFLGLFTFLVVLTHHLTTAMYIVILFGIMLSLTAWNFHEKIMPKIARVFLIFLCSIAIIVGLLYFLPTKYVFISALQSLGKTGSVSVGESYTQLADLAEYPAQAGQFAWYLGLFALMYAVGRIFTKKEGGEKEKIVLLSLVAWFAVVFVMSRSGPSGLPGRFLRECYLPLGILSGVAVEGMFLTVVSRRKKEVIYGMFGVLIAFNLVQVNNGAYRAPDFFNPMIRFDQSDKEKADYIAQISKAEDIIIANPTTPYLPIFTERKIEFLSPIYIKDQIVLEQHLNQTKPKYLFVGKKTLANPDEKVYPFFADFDKLTDSLSLFAKTKKLTVAKKFGDGSTLYVFEPAKKPSTKLK